MSKTTSSDQEPVVKQVKTDEPVHSELNDTVSPSRSLPPFHRQFTSKLFALAFCILLVLVLTSVLFWQSSQQTKSVIQTQVLPLQEKIKQLESLQQSKLIVDELLSGDSEKNWLALHTQLIAQNQQLLRLNSNNTHIYQQWLNQNKVARDVVERAHGNKSRNQQLKQSSIIQIQLMLFSVTNISDTKNSHEKVLYQQLQANKKNDTIALSRSRAYVRAVKQLQNIEKIKNILAEMLTSFEHLTLRTSQEEFELLRLSVEQLFARTKLLQEDKTKAISELVQQVASFKGIVLSEQMALAKWQGYLRLMQSYSLDLKVQKQQIESLLLEPKVNLAPTSSNTLGQLLASYNIHLTDHEIVLILLLVIGVTLIAFSLLLLKIHKQIKNASYHSFAQITQSLHDNEASNINASSQEIEQIVLHIKSLSKPEHDEQEYQVLLNKNQFNEKLINEQKLAFEQLVEDCDVQQKEKHEQVSEQFSYESKRYHYLKDKILTYLVQESSSKNSKSVTLGYEESESAAPPLNHLYEILEQFQLASEIQSNNCILMLNDFNLLEELNCILLNKQLEHSLNNNQLFISYDDKIVPRSNFDVHLVQQLFSLLIDISLQQCQGALLHLILQLQDKNDGQQVIRFNVKVISSNITDLPDTIKQLVQIRRNKEMSASLVEVFKVFLTQLHGENLVAQPIDDGYQLIFDMPLAKSSTVNHNETPSEEHENIALAETRVMLLSTNNVVTSIIENLVLANTGKFEKISRMDSFSQLMSAKHLERNKLDLLIMDSDMGKVELSFIEQAISSLPASLKPKLMVLQSSTLSYQQFGFYAQAEQPLCKVKLLENIASLLAAASNNNQLITADEFQQKRYINSQHQVLLAVKSPQQYQQLQRLLQSLGLQVLFVCNEITLEREWQTGRYSILITEFAQAIWLDMEAQPTMPIGIFGLSNIIAPPELAESDNHNDFVGWTFGKLVSDISLTELESNLLPWLKKAPSKSVPLVKENIDKIYPQDTLVGAAIEDDGNDVIINEVALCLTEDVNSEATFNFSRYLQHQGSVELALFMLDDYSQDNHQQLTNLANAIKDKDIVNAIEAVKRLQLNADILVAEDLQQLCSKWLTLLADDEALSDFNKVNNLLKDTQQVLHAVDSYAETI